MAVLSRGRCVQWAEVGGRKVKVECRGAVQKCWHLARQRIRQVSTRRCFFNA